MIKSLSFLPDKSLYGTKELRLNFKAAEVNLQKIKIPKEITMCCFILLWFFKQTSGSHYFTIKEMPNRRRSELLVSFPEFLLSSENNHKEFNSCFLRFFVKKGSADDKVTEWYLIFFLSRYRLHLIKSDYQSKRISFA